MALGAHDPQAIMDLMDCVCLCQQASVQLVQMKPQFGLQISFQLVGPDCISIL